MNSWQSNKTVKLLLQLGLSMIVSGYGLASAADTTEGRLSVKAFDLPMSALLSEQSRAVLLQPGDAAYQQALAQCASLETVELKKVPSVRRCRQAAFYQSDLYRRHLDAFDVAIKLTTLGGVPVEIFTPNNNVAEKNTHRVLINLHGGSFKRGSQSQSRLESMPIASTGHIIVISIDYRLAPEYQFPAASEDVAAVYQALLNTYRPENIGIYGCSAGGILTAQAMAWFQQEGLPMPGAIGLFCGAASPLDGDSMHITSAFGSRRHFDYVEQQLHSGPRSYYRGRDRKNPLITPAESDEVMSKFPPSLLIASTRDFILSSVIHTHRRLTALGVEADLQIWEGLKHNFHLDPNLPEALEVYDVIVDFFDQHLGQDPKS